MPQLQLYARDSMLELYRDAGIDIDLYRDEPGLEVDRGTAESRDRGGHGNDGAARTAGDANDVSRFRLPRSTGDRRLCEAGPAGRVHLQLLGRGLGRHAVVPPGRR